MAHLLQRPGIKMVTTPVLVGPQGAGKGVIVHLLGALLGSEHYIHSNDMKDVVELGRESPHSQLVLFDYDRLTRGATNNK